MYCVSECTMYMYLGVSFFPSDKYENEALAVVQPSAFPTQHSYVFYYCWHNNPMGGWGEKSGGTEMTTPRLCHILFSISVPGVGWWW